MSSQNHRLSFRSHGLLMELTFVCGFFAVAACVFVLVFLKAGRLSAAAEDISASVNAAQTIVETVLPDGNTVDGTETYSIAFDQDWNRQESPEHAYATAQVTETWDNGLVHMEITVISAGGEELYRLSADRDFS